MTDFSSTFYGKKIFLTGHTGFKGSWMCVWLQLLGANVKGYALKPEKESLYNKIKNRLEIDSVYANILQKEKLKKEILIFQPDFIFHFAAQPLVRDSYLIPVETFNTNVIGTANVLDSLRYLEKKCVCVIVTTDKVYENIEKNYAYKESDKFGGYDPYSASKAAAEIITASFRQSFFNPIDYKNHKKAVATGRAGNVIGGGDYAKDRIIPDIFRALSRNETIQVRNPKAIRPWQHVLEPLNGYLTLASAMKVDPVRYSTSFNFGPDLRDTFTVEELVNFAVKSWGSGKYKAASLKNEPHEAGLLKLNIGKAKKELAWKPKMNSKIAIDMTMKWYKNSLRKNCDVISLCKNDIIEFQKK